MYYVVSDKLKTRNERVRQMATISTINVNDMTFGIEIETAIPIAAGVRVGGYHAGIQIPQLPEGWNAQRDGSIQCPTGHQPCEVVSPKLQGEDGVRQVIAAIEWLKSIDAKINSSTGLHVHVGWKNHNADTTRRLVTMVANFEKALYASTGTHSRENGTYAHSVASDRDYQHSFANRRGLGTNGVSNRFHVLNLQNLSKPVEKRTVEFRVFAGTLNVVKIISAIRLCLGICEKAHSMGKTTSWTAKQPKETSPIHRNGVGQTALTRLFYALGWTKGRESHTFGNVTSDNAPTIDACKKELMRLAKKYDGETHGNAQPYTI